MRQYTLDKLDRVKEILEEFNTQGYLPITLRMLYYKLVTKNIIGNNVNEYNSLKKLMTKTRVSGEIPYEYFVDTTRVLQQADTWWSIPHFLKETLESYRLDRWKTQEYYIEVWLEKNTMIPILEDITSKYSVPLLSNHGYSSTTAMHEAEERFGTDKKCIVIYLGDHDPSGLHMDEDIFNRASVEVDRIAITKAQVDKYHLPPNPAKKRDPRASNYVSEYGENSWELEALDIKITKELLEERILHYLDMDEYTKIIEEEEEHKENFTNFMESMENMFS